MPKLTKTLVDAESHTNKDRFVWDSDLKGFGLKIFARPSETKSFVFQYRDPQGDTRRLTIGKFSQSLTADQARKLAKDYAFEVHADRDPASEKQVRREALSVNDLFDLYVKSERFTDNAATTQATDRGRIDRHIRVLLGKEIVDNLTEEQVKKAHRAIIAGKTKARVKTKARGLAKVTGGTGTADKCALLLSVACNWAIENKFCKTNPAAGIKVAPSGERDAVLRDAKDYGRLFEALDKMQTEKRIRSAAADAIRFIALTGARRGEATGLRWEWVDLDAGLITIPPRNKHNQTGHKTGRRTGKPRLISLPAEARAIIARQPAAEPDDFVFQPKKGEGPLALGKIWPTVRTEAKLPADLVLHSLRHSIGTSLATASASNVEIMEQLGHKQISTSMRYIHFAERARSTLADRAAATALAGLAEAAKKDGGGDK